jgi:hypothetical protein
MTTCQNLVTGTFCITVRYIHLSKHLQQKTRTTVAIVKNLCYNLGHTLLSYLSRTWVSNEPASSLPWEKAMVNYY